MFRKKRYLVHVDILGFGPLADEIAKAKLLEPADVRDKFKNVIEGKLKEARKESSFKVIDQGIDDWTLAIESKEEVFLVISKILDHYTGYQDYKTIPLEIAIGIAEYGKWADEDKLGNENETIDYLKSNLIGKYHKWHKDVHKVSVRDTFIVTKSFFNELSVSKQEECQEIQHKGSHFYYLPESLIKRQRRITEFLKEIGQARSDFSGASIDKIFVPPDGYGEIKETLENDKIVFITGPAGYGKTYTTIKLLWKYHKKGYIPRWISGKDEIERRDVRDKLANIETQLEPGHIIYFEDPFGKTKYERRDDLKERVNYILNGVKNANKDINGVENEKKVFVIVTSRKDVFEEFEKENYSVEEIRKFERELKLDIKQPSYNSDKRKEMLEKWAIEKNCKWLKNEETNYFVFKSVKNAKKLPNPLSIYDFVEATINTTDLHELKEKISGYSGSVEKAFADEIIGLYKSGRKDRVLFLSFIFISEHFKVDFVKKEYETMKGEDFENILKEEYRVKERSFGNDKYLGFSHPSYYGSIKHILNHIGCRNTFWEVVDKLLDNEDHYIRRITVETLGELGDPQAVEYLMQSLKDTDWYVQIKAADALVKIGKPTVEWLILALEDTNRGVRRRAVEALGKIGDLKAVEPLILMLKDKDDDVRMEAADALGRLRDLQAVEPLILSLDDNERGVRSRAADALGKLGDTQAVEPLILTLKDPSRGVRIKTVWALGEIGDLRAVMPLTHTISDQNWDVRMEAARALGRLEDEQAAEYLIQTLKDPKENVRIKTAWALGRLNNPQTVDPLIQTLNDKDKDVRMEVAWALGEISDLRSVQPLIGALKDENMRVQETARNALDKIGKHQIKKLNPVFTSFKC